MWYMITEFIRFKSNKVKLHIPNSETSRKKDTYGRQKYTCLAKLLSDFAKVRSSDNTDSNNL